MSSSSYLRQVLNGMTLVKGFGGQECCSIQAINRVLHCRDTDSCPPGMSFSMYQWIIIVNDTMTYEERNSARWKDFLACAADTPGCDAHKVILHRWLGNVLKGLPVPYCEKFVILVDHWDTGELAVCVREYCYKWCRGGIHNRISFGLSNYVNRGDCSPLLTRLANCGYITIDPYSVLEEMVNEAKRIS